MMLNDGLIVEYMDLSYIHLAVIILFFLSAQFDSYLPSPECSTDEKDMIASNSGN